MRTGSAAAAVTFVLDDALGPLEHPASPAATTAGANQTPIGLNRSRCTPTTTLRQPARLAGVPTPLAAVKGHSACTFYHRPVSREQSTAAIECFRVACRDHPLVVAAFLGGSYAAGRARRDSDIDLYLVTRPEDYSTFIADRQRFIRTWGDPTQLEDIWNFEGLGFDMTAFTMADGVHGEIAYGTTANFLNLHGGPHEVLVDKAGLLDGVTFPLL